MQIDARSVGLRLVELARVNQGAKPVEELYRENIASIEVMVGANDEPQIGTGVEASYEKHAWWESVATVHGIDIEGPFADNGDDDFVARCKMVVTIEGQRSQMSEVGVYTMAKGKIVKEAYLDLVSQLYRLA